jgi:hypothetical protein
MGKNLKLAPAIIFFLFLFLITNVGATKPTIYETSNKCESIIDCPKLIAFSEQVANICMNGYCHILRFDT